MSDASTTDTADTTTTETAPEPEKDWKAIAEQTEKRLKRFEDQAKANAAAAKELEQLRASSMTELEKAVAAAKVEGLAEGSRSASAKLVAAEIKAALAGRQVDVEAILEGVDPLRFLDEDGDPNIPAILAWADRIAPPPDPNEKPGFPDLRQGVRGGGTTTTDDPLVADLKRLVGNSFGNRR